MGYRLRSRIEAGFQHVTARGVDKQALFKSEQDYQHYLNLLALYAGRHRSHLYAFCLMPNHIHLLLRPNADMSNLVQNIHSSYARWFNEQYSRVGHLFQGRFHSKTIVSNEHFISAGRYIHMNPVAAALVSDPREYRWSSLNHYLTTTAPPWLDRELLLGPHSGDKRKFINFTLKSAEIPEDRNPPGFETKNEEIPTASTPKPNDPSTESVVQAVATAFSCGLACITSPSKNPQPFGARAAALLALRAKLKLSLKEAARYLRYKSPKSAGNSIRSLRRRISNSIDLRKKIEMLDLT